MLIASRGAGTRPLATILSPTLAANGGATPTHALVQNSLAIGPAANNQQSPEVKPEETPEQSHGDDKKSDDEKKN